MEFFNYNGKILKPDTAIIGPDSRGLRFGDGLFETMKSVNNQLEFADDHFARLWKGMDLMQFKIPVHFDPERLKAEINELLNKNGHNDKARVRLTVFRGDGGLYDEISHIPEYIIQSWELPEDSGKWNSNGLQLDIYYNARKNCDRFSNIKHNNFLPYAMAALEAKKQRWNDAVLLNNHERICETTNTNIFIIKNDIIHTPALSEGCIAGIMRKNVLLHLHTTGWNVVEDKITIEDLFIADEVFLTSSIQGIRWVQSIGDKKYSNVITQKIYSSFLPTIS
jgi:branched-subunit amino acid aminotransferase/4-amino-4-deoxychorismate lyase